MNVFFLDNCPKKAAMFMVDSHTRGKMLVEACQLLASAYSLSLLKSAPPTKTGAPRKHFNPNHPCAVWTRNSLSNFNWLVKHGNALYEEKCFRFGGDHYSIDFVRWCRDNPPNLPDKGLTTPALAFNGCDQFKDPSDPVDSYRRFYIADKRFDERGRPMDIYSVRERPAWWGPIFEEIKHLI